LAKHSKLFLCLGYADLPLGRKTAEIACIQGDSSEAAAIDLREESIKPLWRNIQEKSQAGIICWDLKSCLLSQGISGIRTEHIPDDVMLMAFLVELTSAIIH